MSVLTILLAVQAAASPAVPAPQATPRPAARAVPTDWTPLAPVPWKSPPQITPELTGFVSKEVRERRCAAARPLGQRTELDVELAVKIRADGRVAGVVPRAIDCPTVEQFAAGLVSSFARNNLRTAAEGWYRTTVTFAWN